MASSTLESPTKSLTSVRDPPKTIPPQIPRQLRSILTDILATRQRYLDICSDTLDTANSVVNLTLKRNNARAKRKKWAPGETEDELGWEIIASDLEEERKETLEYLREVSTSKLKTQLSRLDLANQRLSALVNETARNYGLAMTRDVAAIPFLTLDGILTWSQMTFNSYTKDYELRSALVDRHLSAVKTRQEAVLYLTAWKYGPYLDDDPSGEIPDSAGLRVLIEEALRES